MEHGNVVDIGVPSCDTTAGTLELASEEEARDSCQVASDLLRTVVWTHNLMRYLPVTDLARGTTRGRYCPTLQITV